MSDNNDQNQYKRGPSVYDLDKRVTLLESVQVRMQEDLHAINSNTTKLVWILITALVLAVLKTVLKV